MRGFWWGFSSSLGRMLGQLLWLGILGLVGLGLYRVLPPGGPQAWVRWILQ